MSTEVEQDKAAMQVGTWDSGAGDARVYLLDPPMKYHVYDWERGGEQVEHETRYVIVSAVNDYAYETYIFPSDGDGVTHWGELEGSLQGVNDHELVLINAGYRVVDVIEGRVN